MTYFNSEDIRVFPCAYRGFKPTESTEALDAEPTVWNADASLTTEYNLTHMFSHLLGQQSFIVSSPKKTIDENADLKCVINGYYFEIDGAAFREAYAGGTSDAWLDTLRGERKGCLCIRVLPKFEVTDSEKSPATADFNLTSLITMDLNQTSEGYLLDDNESGKFMGLAFYPDMSSIPSPTDGSVVYSLPLGDESLYAETVYQEIKEKIIEGVKAVNWSKHLEVAPLSVGTDRVINLNSYAGIGNLHTFYVGDLKALCTDKNKALLDMANFPSALGNSSTFAKADPPDLFIALEVFDPGIGSESSPRTSPVIQVLHTFGYSEAKVAVEHKSQTDVIRNTYESIIEKDEKDSDYYTKEFDSDYCTFIRYGHRDSSGSGDKIDWDPWEGLSDEELKLFACVRAMEAEQRLTDALILGNTVPRFAERLGANKKTERLIHADLEPGWYYYVQSSISALKFLGGADSLDPNVSWEQKQLLNEATSYTALLEVIGDDKNGNIPCLQRIFIFDVDSYNYYNNKVIASCSRAVNRSLKTSEKWAFNITSTNIRDQSVALAEKQKVHQISTYAGLKTLIEDLCDKLSSNTTIGSCLQVELQFTNLVDLEVPLSPLDPNQIFYISPCNVGPGTVGHLILRWDASNKVFQLLLELQRFSSGVGGISFSQTLSAEPKDPIDFEALKWEVRYPTNVQNPIPLNNYEDLVSLQAQLMEEMPFGHLGKEATSAENNLSVPVVIVGSQFTMFTMEDISASYYVIPRGSIGYLAVLADQMIPENPDNYGPNPSYPFVFSLSLLTPKDNSWDNSWDKSCFTARQYYGRGETEIWEISESHVALADRATVAESIKGTAVNGKVSYAKRADVAARAEQVYGKDVINAVRSAAKAGTASKAFNLSLDASSISQDGDTDTGFGDSIIGSTVIAHAKAPGLYLVEVVIKDALGLNAFRDSTFFFIPEYSDKHAPRTKQVLCSGMVVLDTYYDYAQNTGKFTSAAFNAQALGGFSGSISTDLAIKVWRIAEASGKANGPFQNK